MPASPAQRLRRAARKLSRELADLRFAKPVTHVYDPVDYARRPYYAYLDRFGATPKRVVFLGMNPGPFGMAQTGVPFGEVSAVRDYLGIEDRVGRPAGEHPKRPIEGFGCQRSEVSGTRVWGTIEAEFGAPERFFDRHFIANYCPLVFMEASGRNRTPDKLPVKERQALFAACDTHLLQVVRALEPEWVVGIGAFAEGRALEALEGRVKVGRILHPSPANPRAQKDWGGKARRELEALGICKPRRKRAGPARQKR